jgi:hypothetical protein
MYLLNCVELGAGIRTEHPPHYAITALSRLAKQLQQTFCLGLNNQLLSLFPHNDKGTSAVIPRFVSDPFVSLLIHERALPSVLSDFDALELASLLQNGDRASS